MDLQTMQEPPVHAVSPEPCFVEARPMTCIAVQGGPADGAEPVHLDALTRVAATVQAEAIAVGRGFPLGSLERLRWPWRWMHLLRVPEYVAPRDVRRARRLVPGDDLLLGAVRVERLREGRCVQALHESGGLERTYDALRRFAREHGQQPAGPAHDLFLDDGDGRVVCRLPVRPAYVPVRGSAGPAGPA